MYKMKTVLDSNQNINIDNHDSFTTKKAYVRKEYYDHKKINGSRIQRRETRTTRTTTKNSRRIGRNDHAMVKQLITTVTIITWISSSLLFFGNHFASALSIPQTKLNPTFIIGSRNKYLSSSSSSSSLVAAFDHHHKKNTRQRRKCNIAVLWMSEPIGDIGGGSSSSSSSKSNNGDSVTGNRPEIRSLSSKFLNDNDIVLVEDEDSGRVVANKKPTGSGSGSGSVKKSKFLQEIVPKIDPLTKGFNVVLTHCTADFDTLASAVGLAKLWSTSTTSNNNNNNNSSSTTTAEEDGQKAFSSSEGLPTYVVLPRGAHPDVQKFLALHKHLFPIRSLKSFSTEDLSKLHRLGLVDAQRRERIGPAETLLPYADRITIVDHHVESDSDIILHAQSNTKKEKVETDYIVESVGSVSTMIAERLRGSCEITEAEATLLALGIHADTGSLTFDSSTTRDAEALAWVMAQGASQVAIAEHAKASLSPDQHGVLTQALINANSTVVHGVTVSTVLLSADGFINGLAAVTQDALELSSSDIFLLAVVYDAKPRKRNSSTGNNSNASSKHALSKKILSTSASGEKQKQSMIHNHNQRQASMEDAWKGGENALRRKRLLAAFERFDIDGSGYLEVNEISAALASTGVIAREQSIISLLEEIDTDGDGKIDFGEFVAFAEDAEARQQASGKEGKRNPTMTVIGRVKAGVNMKSVNLNHLFEQFGGGGHAKAASCTVRLGDESEAIGILQGLLDEMIETSLMKQPTVADFMTSPVLSAKPTMTEKQVEDLFTLYDVRALPVVDDNNDVIGLVTYKEVAAAKQRLFNKEQKRLRQEAKRLKQQAAAAAKNNNNDDDDATNQKKKDDPSQQYNAYYNKKKRESRKLGSPLKAWMKEHVLIVDASMTMAEVESYLLENDVGCIPVVAEGTKQLVGMVTRTDLLRQHKYYSGLHYHNKGFANSIAARKPIIELRKKLKQFDVDE